MGWAGRHKVLSPTDLEPCSALASSCLAAAGVSGGGSHSMPARVEFPGSLLNAMGEPRARVSGLLGKSVKTLTPGKQVPGERDACRGGSPWLSEGVKRGFTEPMSSWVRMRELTGWSTGTQL